jgi:hypothetical protein
MQSERAKICSSRGHEAEFGDLPFHSLLTSAATSDCIVTAE